jgi:hypothetical protein
MIKIRFMKIYSDLAEFLKGFNTDIEREINLQQHSNETGLLDILFMMINTQGYMKVDCSNYNDISQLNFLIHKAKNCKNRDLLVYVEIIFKLSESNNILKELLDRINDMKQIVYNYDYAIYDMQENDHYSLYFINELTLKLRIEKTEQNFDLKVYSNLDVFISDIKEIIINKYCAHILDDESDLIIRYIIDPINNSEIKSLYHIVMSMMMNDNKSVNYNNDNEDKKLIREKTYYTIYEDCINLISFTNWTDE